jgi:NADH-ubiquinone oxidoreductase chain 3
MTSTTFFIIFVPILAILLLAINLILAPHNPYQEKDSVFECGFHSFLGQNRTQFSVSFFIFGLLFLLFDLEILLVYPYSVSSYTNDIYGLVVMMVFFVLLTLGFIFELGKNALTIDSRQTTYSKGDLFTPHAFLSVVGPILYSLSHTLELFVDRIPSGSQLAEGRNLRQVSEVANNYTGQLNTIHARLIAEGNRELNMDNTGPGLTREIETVMDNADILKSNAMTQLAEAAQIALDLLG